jgi:polyferredoxin
MKKRKSGSWDESTDLARAILYDRPERRKWMGYLMLVPIGMLALGVWGIPEWLKESPIRFLVWWGVCAVSTLAVMIFALYDALAVIREERDNRP